MRRRARPAPLAQAQNRRSASALAGRAGRGPTSGSGPGSPPPAVTSGAAIFLRGGRRALWPRGNVPRGEALIQAKGGSWTFNKEILGLGLSAFQTETQTHTSAAFTFYPRMEVTCPTVTRWTCGLSGL